MCCSKQHSASHTTSMENHHPRFIWEIFFYLFSCQDKEAFKTWLVMEWLCGCDSPAATTCTCTATKLSSVYLHKPPIALLCVHAFSALPPSVSLMPLLLGYIVCTGPMQHIQASLVFLLEI